MSNPSLSTLTPPLNPLLTHIIGKDGEDLSYAVAASNGIRIHSVQPSSSCVLRLEVLSLSESLHLSEKVVTDSVQETKEWSVLDAKELVEP